jgi:hypothetical protein
VGTVPTSNTTRKRLCPNRRETMKNVFFSINQYDKDGDAIDECILLHIGDDVILRLNGKEELDSLIEQLKNCQRQIERIGKN